MKKTGAKIYSEHSKSKRVFGDAIDWVDRPKRKAGRRNRKKTTRIANHRERRLYATTTEVLNYSDTL